MAHTKPSYLFKVKWTDVCIYFENAWDKRPEKNVQLKLLRELSIIMDGVDWEWGAVKYFGEFRRRPQHFCKFTEGGHNGGETTNSLDAFQRVPQNLSTHLRRGMKCLSSLNISFIPPPTIIVDNSHM